jgi:hypothetical protein
MQSCDQTCSWCARNFWAWLKSRLANGAYQDGRSGEGSFAEAAATSIKGSPVAQGQNTYVVFRKEPDGTEHDVAWVTSLSAAFASVRLYKEHNPQTTASFFASHESSGDLYTYIPEWPSSWKREE